MNAVTSNNSQDLLLEWTNNTGDEFPKDIAGKTLHDSKDTNNTHTNFRQQRIVIQS